MARRNRFSGLASGPIQLQASAQSSVPLDPLAAALLASGLQGGPVKHPLQGAGRLAQALAGAFLQRRSQDTASQQKAADSQALARALATITGGVPAFTDPDTGVETVPAVPPGQQSLSAALASTDNSSVIDRLAPLGIAQALKGRPAEGFTLGAGQRRFGAGGEEIARGGPKPLVPGRDTPYSPEVLEQLIDIAGAEKASEIKAVLGGLGRGELVRRDLTPAELKVDETFGKDYADFIGRGGFADAEKNITQLRGVRDQLAAGEELTGGIKGYLPTVLRTPFAPESVAAQETVEEVVQRNLRLILGAQFTEREGIRLIERAFNPRLSEAENVKRIDRLLDAMDTALEAKRAASEYYEASGSLRGFKGTAQMSKLEFYDLATGGEGASILDPTTPSAAAQPAGKFEGKSISQMSLEELTALPKSGMSFEQLRAASAALKERLAEAQRQ